MKAQLAANAAAATASAQAMQKVTIPNPRPEDDSDDEDPSPQASPVVRRSAAPAGGGSGAAAAADPAPAEGTLEAAMGGLNLQQAPAPLKGVPLSEGVHTRFDADGVANDSPAAANGASTKTVLRGVPPPAGTKVIFED